ncbi:unnamed protein product, partial [Porites evermanni]
IKTSVIFEFTTSTVKMASSDNDSVPHISDMDSPGSSVSSALQREYEELLKYAVVTPKIQVCPTVYEQSVTTKDDVTASTETDSNSSSSTSSSTSVSTRSSKSEEVSHTAAKEDVKQLPSTPSLRVSFQGQGSIARDSLLRDESSSTITAAKTPDVEEKSLSSLSPEESPGTPPAPASPVIDADLARMEALLDNWCLDLKRNVLAEFAQCKMGLFEKQKQLLMQEKRRYCTLF